MYFSDVEQTGETDFVLKLKSIYGTPFGKVAVPESEQVAIRLISGGKVTYTFKLVLTKKTK